MIARAIGLKNNKTTLLLLIIIAIFFAGLRGDIGTDVIAYRRYYDDVGARDVNVVFEPIFLILSLLGNAANLSSQFLIFSVAALQGFFIFQIVKRIEESDLFYLLLIATFFVYLQMNLIRVGLALCIVSFALALKLEQKKSVVPLFILGILTHVTAVFALPLFSKRWYKAIPILIVAVFVFQDFFLNKVIAYFSNEDSIRGEKEYVGIGFLLSLAIIAYCITVEKKWTNRAIFISFFAFGIFKIAITLFPAFDRISQIYSMPLFLLLLYGRVKPQTRLALLILIAYNTYGSLSFIVNSDAAMDALISDNPSFALNYADAKWLPYEFFWN